jgi:hypothetical protein
VGKQVLRQLTVFRLAKQVFGLGEFLYNRQFFPAKPIFVYDLNRRLLLLSRGKEMDIHLEFLWLKNFTLELRVAPARVDV